MVEGLQGLSLLWPPGRAAGTAAAVTPVPGTPAAAAALSDEQAADLELDALVDHLCLDSADRPHVKDTLLRFCTDPAVIAYRHGILDSLLDAPSASMRLAALLPKLRRLEQRHLPREKGELLHEIAWRLGELEIFLECIGELAAILASLVEPAEGLRLMRDAVRSLQDSEPVRQLASSLPGMLREVRGTRSITLGVNVDADLQPSSVALLSVNARAYDGRSHSLLRKLFGAGPAAANAIAPLHRVPSEAPHPMLHPVFRDLSELLARSLRPVAAELQRFVGVQTEFLDRWGRELSFFLGAGRLVERLRNAGLPLCRPRLDDSEGFSVQDCYNVVLALKVAERNRGGNLADAVVKNDVSLGPREIAILTGPNQGGKTTFLRAVGLAHVMCQAGLYVPGTRAAVGIVDAVLTHFPRSEAGELEMGRFADEMRRMRDLFARATPRSLILFNESLAATNAAESLEVAREVVEALQVLSARVIFATHLYELAAESDAFNSNGTECGRVTSLVANAGRSYRIERRPPDGTSHAREVARQYGVSYAQLIEVLKGRGIG